MTAIIEDLYIYDHSHTCILQHTFTSRPIPALTLINLYLAQPTPRPSTLYLPLNPPTILFSIHQDGLLFLAPQSTETPPLLVLEFLHRVADALQEFLGSPSLAAEIEAHYDVIAQVLAEMCDAGLVAQTEANALRDVVETPSMMDKLFAGIGLPGTGLTQSTSAHLLPGTGPGLQPPPSQIPWRRSNVRHTSNELYVDIVESLHVIYAPSGRPISGFANGSVAFTSKVSGVPDLLLTLSLPGGSSSSGRGVPPGSQTRKVMERPVFHPCVRLSKWKDSGVLSFVPPDGRFMLMGYETDLLHTTNASNPLSANPTDLNLPLGVEVRKSLGQLGTEFEVKITLNTHALTRPGNAFGSGLGVGTSTPASRGKPDPKTRQVEDLNVKIDLPPTVRNVNELRASKGEASWSVTEGNVEWTVSSKVLSTLTTSSMTLRCTVVGADEDQGMDMDMGITDLRARTEDEWGYDASPLPSPVKKVDKDRDTRNMRLVERNKGLMPLCVRVGFSVRGWLASGIKVESLVVDTRRSRGVGEGVKPYKGVKYLCVSEGGIEVRC